MSTSSAMSVPTLEMLENELAREQHRRSRILAAFAIAAVIVSLSVAFVLRQGGLAFTHEEQVLECCYDGVAAHTHDEYCYDEDGNLVCTMPEAELHVHTEECYDESGELICDLDDYTHEHVHGAGCFRTIVVEDEEFDEEYDDTVDEVSDPESLGDYVGTDEDVEGDDTVDEQADDTTTEETIDATEENAMPSQTFETQVVDENDVPILTVSATAPEGALPAKSTMQVRVVTENDIQDIVSDEVYAQTNSRVTGLQSIDIVFYDEAGNEIKPEKPLTVKLTSDLISEDEENLVVQVSDEGEARIVTVLEEEEVELLEETVEENEIVFETQEF